MVLFLAEYEYDNPRCHIASMTNEYGSFEKRVSNYTHFKIAQNWLPWIAFDAEYEYDTIRCIFQAWVMQHQNYGASLQNY